MKTPIIVDLDETLVLQDRFQELLFLDFKKRPLSVIKELANKPILEVKKRLFSSPFEFEPSFNQEVIQYLKTKKNDGHKVYLVTASPQEYADFVAAKLNGLIDITYGSTDINLKGENKLKFIQKNISREFEYLGDSTSDKIIFAKSNSFIKINKSKGQHLSKLIRVKHWVKNLIIFLPLLLTPTQLFSTDLIYLLIGFITFSLTASFGYILNDLMDFESDRSHAVKRFRPIARGIFSIKDSLFLLSVLLILILCLSSFLPKGAILMLGLYFIVNTAYSFWIKEIRWLDIIILTSLYLIRLEFGGAISNITLTYWLTFTSFFSFFSLSADKRLNELINQGKNKRRGYTDHDIIPLNIIRYSSALIAASIFNQLMYETLPIKGSIRNYITILGFLTTLYSFLKVFDSKEENLVKKILSSKSVIISLIVISILYFVVKYV